MAGRLDKKILFFGFIVLPGLLIVLAGLGGIVLLFLGESPGLPILAGITAEKVNIPLDTIDLGFAKFTLETQNYLLFQVFESLPPRLFPIITQLTGGILWMLFSLAVILFTDFKRYYFIAATGAAIFLMTLGGINGLNIGGIGSNNAMILALVGLVLPAVVIQTFFNSKGWTFRAVVILMISGLTYFLLIRLSGTMAPTLLLAENISLMAAAVAGIFLIYIGHTAISAIYLMLAKLNRGVGLRISWHLSIFSLLYLSLITLIFFRLMGEVDLGFPLPPIFILFVVVACMAYLETRVKIRTVDQPYGHPWVGEGVFLIGFAVTALVWFRADLVANTPLSDFLQHLFIYSQLGFGALFFLYLITNFLGIMNTGNAVEKIIYRPPFFSILHMRIGGLMSMLILTIYADGVVGVQFGTASTHLSADYYYGTGRTREASILYENSFDRYRNNPKALNAVAHIALDQKQPTLAINTLMKSFDTRPQVSDILLLSANLLKVGKVTEALFYLKQGLTHYPDNEYLLNNLALVSSRVNQGKEGHLLLSQMEKHAAIRDANLIGLEIKHRLPHNTEASDENLAGTINALARYNLAGEKAPIALETDSISQGSLLNKALLRNQWSNHATGDIDADLVLLDSLIAQNFLPSEEAELRETGSVRNYQSDRINELLKTLNGLAYNFPNSAGFYHSFEALVFLGQMDFEKSAQSWVRAEEKGFSKFTDDHLPILYFGGMPEEAEIIALKYSLSYPDWMTWDNNGNLIPNDTLHLVKGLARLLPSLKKDFWGDFERISDPALKGFFAYQVLLRKSHWLDEAEMDTLAEAVTAYPPLDEREEMDMLIQALRSSTTPEGSEALTSLNRYYGQKSAANAYWTPILLQRLAALEEDLDRYNLLQDAAQFNKDPLLWIELVRYSRILGLDRYASENLNTMSEWISGEDLIELQLKHF